MNKYAVSTAAAIAVTAGVVHADGDVSQADVVSQLQSEVAKLRAELDEVKAQTSRDWMTEARAEEMRNIVYDVLADADTRASLLQDGANAGYDGGFFINSPDGKFSLKLGGQLQVRYIFNTRDDGGGGIDEDQFGFQVRRAKLIGKGHIGDPKIGFGFSLAGDRGEDNAFFEDYFLNYKFDNGVLVQAGRWKQPYSRENIMSSTKQMAVERSLVLETFNVDRSDGVMLAYEADQWRLSGAWNDGIDGDNTDFNADGVDFGLTGRVDFLVMGDWKQMEDFASWSGEDDALFLGGGVHYQEGETDSASEDMEVLLLTGDVLYEYNGLSLFGAVYYSDINQDALDTENWGLEGQVAYNINDTYEPFLRYEVIMLDDDIAGLVEDEIHLITVGMNWYQKKHNAKFTIDLVYVFDHIDDDASDFTMLDPSAGLGLVDDDGDEDGQLAIRAQYQLAF